MDGLRVIRSASRSVLASVGLAVCAGPGGYIGCWCGDVSLLRESRWRPNSRSQDQLQDRAPHLQGRHGRQAARRLELFGVSRALLPGRSRWQLGIHVVASLDLSPPCHVGGSGRAHPWGRKRRRLGQ